MTTTVERRSLLLRRARLLVDRRGDYRRARALLEPALGSALADEPEFRYLLAVAWDRLGRHDEALALVRSARRGCEEYRDPLLYRQIANHEGGALLRRGRLREAEELFLQVMGSAGEAEDDVAAMRACQNLGVVSHVRGHLAHALTHYQRAMAAFQRRGQRRDVGRVHQNMAMIYLAIGRHAESHSHFEHATRLLRRYGSADDTIRVECARALLLSATGDQALALKTARRAHAEALRLGIRREVAEALRVIGIARGRSGELAAARESLEDALAAARETASPELEAEVMEELAVLARHAGDPSGEASLAAAAAAAYEAMGADPRAERMRARLAALREGVTRASRRSGAGELQE